ncbi:MULTISPECIES: arsenite efflux transporter metallochaperone ArsD [Salinicoccus]|uniref:Arsenic resistance operon repressor n=1 Tax=Salinicoccus halodurans TaxID=407035 RepID=A0A0F7D4Q4_9STAP|nr:MULTISPECIES: arsenite efflux transporter metallochaperone ArsD [Salinicoccus]AKG74640.1 arsenic resistance operon repressor [Salinicoccus halodurans]SFK88960.1 Arsenical resistance operon trans-acting repressor ArsD [Salinicoccus halodurans]
MLEVKFYEEEMCCSTGVCGPSPDETLIKVNQLVEALKSNNINVERFNLTSSPNEFIGNKNIISKIKEQGVEILPITVIDDQIVKMKEYMTEEEVNDIIMVNQLRNGGCCGGDGCC